MRFIVTYLSFSCLVVSAAFAQNASDLVTSAGQKYSAGDFAGAIADYTKALESHPTDQALIYYNRASCRNAVGDFDGAIADDTKAIELKPPFIVAVYYDRARADKSKGDAASAITDCTKAIETDVTFVPAYDLRGGLRYNQRAWKDALSDFQTYSKLHPGDDYASLRIWLARQRLGEKDVANTELQDYLKTRKGDPDEWPARIGGFLAGQVTEASLLKAAASTDKQHDAELRCEAYFYAGSKRLIEGDRAGATDYFEKCVSTGMKNFSEYQSAVAELRQLKPEK